MNNHSKFLRRCFELAQKGESLAFPNPIVGCLIVKDDKIIAEGFHHSYGAAHAEVEAINQAIEKGHEKDLKDSSIYVSLEPCSHHGKTPPCADLIIKHQFKELIFSSYDPNPLVSGKGISRIKEAGIKVIEASSLDEETKNESDFLNRVFFKTVQKSDSKWLTLKIALTAEGSMINDPGEPRWFTNESSKKDVHRLRSCHDLLISTAKTVIDDNPSLNVRFNGRELNLETIKNPDIAIVSRSQQSLNEKDFKVFNLDKERKVFQCTSLEAALDLAYTRVLIEAGPSFSKYILDSGFADEVIVYQNQKTDELNQSWQKVIERSGYQLRKSELFTVADSIDLKEIFTH